MKITNLEPTDIVHRPKEIETIKGEKTDISDMFLGSTDVSVQKRIQGLLAIKVRSREEISKRKTQNNKKEKTITTGFYRLL